VDFRSTSRYLVLGRLLYNNYTTKLDLFRAVVKERELKMYSSEILSKEWMNVHENAGVLVSSALES